MNNFNQQIEQFRLRAIELAFLEDSALGDHTSMACIPPGTRNKAVLKVKDSGIISGISVAQMVLTYVDPTITFTPLLRDGDRISPGDIAFKAEGPVHALLKAERVLLNLMQRMSGIATKTAQYVEKISDTKAKLLDTRKTAPCLRYFDKEAVRHGGGHNHRWGLYDMIMVKDNHIDYAGGIEKAIRRVQDYLKNHNLSLEIEVEARTMSDIEKILDIGGIHRIMLDNFTIEATYKAVQRVAGAVQLESSGGITIENIRDYALTGVDFISVGALTHNVKGLDLSLKAI